MKKRTKQKDGYYVKVPRFDLGGYNDFSNVTGDGLFHGDNSRNMLANQSGKTAGAASESTGMSASGFNSIAQLGAAGVNMFQPGNGDSSAGLGAVSGALSGAGTGAMIGSVIPGVGTLVGGAVGGVIGGAAGLISGGKKHAAYETMQKQNTQNAYFGQRGNMQQANQDMYGGNYALGDLIGPGDPKSKYNISQTGNLPPNNDPYWKANPLLTQHDPMVDESTPWGYKPHLSTPDLSMQQALHPQYLPSDKQAGFSNSYYPANGIQQLPAIPTIHKSAGYYANGDQVTDGDNVNTQDDPAFQAQRAAQGQPTAINIEKGELRIDAQKGKILQEYKGVNPMTGGLFTPHSKDGKDSIHNMTQANEGDFIVTKKRAKQYKDAVDNNDQIAKDTILMNIRNNKVASQGGLRPKRYAEGDYVPQTSYSQYSNMLGIPNNTIPMPTNPAMPSQNTLANTTNVSPYKVSTPNIASNNYDHKDNFGDTLSKYGPSIFNMAQGLFGKVNTQPQGQTAVNPYLANIQANMPKNISYDPLISEANAQSNLAVKDLQNRTNNAGVYRANRQAISSNTTKNIANIKMQTAEANNNVARQRAGIYEGLGQQSMQDQQQLRNYNFGVNDANNKAQAAKQNYLNTGLSQLQQTYMNDKTNSQRENMDRYQIQLMKQIYPSITPYDWSDPNNAFRAKYRG